MNIMFGDKFEVRHGDKSLIYPEENTKEITKTCEEGGDIFIEPLKINPITNKIDVPIEAVKTFMLCFMSVIWRRVLVNSLVYAVHNNTKLEKNIIVKCIKYNLFSDSGIGIVMKPYIKRSIENGYIMPNVFNRNIYVHRSIMLYKEALNIVKHDNRDIEIKFISNYALSIFDDINKKELEQEKKDIVDAVLDYTIFEDEKDEGIFDQLEIGKTLGIDNNIPVNNISVNNKSTILCQCTLCKTVDNWDINPDLIFCDEPYEKIIMNGLLGLSSNIDL
jgi:hypothetical protein